MTGYPFRPQHRLRKPQEFARVFASEVVAADDVLVVRGCHATGNSARLGLIVSRKVGPAVVRNAWKRRIREAFRLCRPTLPALDLVVRPRRGAACDFHAIQRSLPQLASRIQRKLGPRSAEPDS